MSASSQQIVEAKQQDEQQDQQQEQEKYTPNNEYKVHQQQLNEQLQYFNHNMAFLTMTQQKQFEDLTEQIRNLNFEDFKDEKYCQLMVKDCKLIAIEIY